MSCLRVFVFMFFASCSKVTGERIMREEIAVNGTHDFENGKNCPPKGRTFGIIKAARGFGRDDGIAAVKKSGCNSVCSIPGYGTEQYGRHTLDKVCYTCCETNVESTTGKSCPPEGRGFGIIKGDRGFDRDDGIRAVRATGCKDVCSVQGYGNNKRCYL